MNDPNRGAAALGPSLARGYASCAAITREHGTTYYWGARLLPAERRRHVHALYALARLADDIVDLAGPTPGPQTAAELDAFETTFWTTLHDNASRDSSGPATDPVMAAIVTSVRACQIDEACFERFFAAMRADLTQRTYATWEDLLVYMDGSAAVIGEMMLPVLQPSVDALAPARALGLAFQLTNFLRDIDEDLTRGRVYVPQEDLDRFGADPHARRVDDAWRALMRFEIERNRRLYREADDGIPALTGASRRCVATARILYARILERIEAADYDVFGGRVRVPTPAKAALAARMVVARDPWRRVQADRAARTGGSAWHDDDLVVLLDPAGNAIGSAPKSTVHHDDTPLHLAFSCYVVDPDGRLLLTVRARSKPSFPGVLTNSVCGHPQPGEDLAEAVRRRAADELGVQLGEVRLVLPRFTYRAVAADGLVEHEQCPVFLGVAADHRFRLDPAEVDSARWEPWDSVVRDVTGSGLAVSSWCREQITQLALLGSDPLAWPRAEATGLPPAATGSVAHSEVDGG